MIELSKTAIRALLPKNAFARGVSVLVGGTASAQILLVLAAPILTRLYTPEDFGLLAVYASLLALIGVISSLRYELAILLPEDDVEAANVAVLSLLLVGISTALTAVLVLMLGTSIAELLGVPVLANYLWLLPVGVLLSGAYSVFNYWSVRTKRFSTIAQTKLTQAIATLAIQLATFKFGGIGLLLGQVAGQSVGTTSLARPALAMQAFKQVSWVGIRNALVRYRRFPMFSTWAGFSNTAGLQLPPLMFSALFGPAMAGLYSLSHRILSLPMSLVGSAVSQVFLSDGADAHRNDQLPQLVRRLHNTLAQIAFPPALLRALLGPDLFGLVFGTTWRDAGVISQWLAPWIYLVFITSPLSMLFTIREKQLQGLVFQVSLLFARVVAILTGYLIGNFFIAVAIYALASAGMRLVLMVVLLRDYYSSLADLFYPTFTSALWSLMIVIPALWVIVSIDVSLFEFWSALIFSCCLISIRYYFLARNVSSSLAKT